jgi:hypothetical protein
MKMPANLPDVALVVAWREKEAFRFGQVDTAGDVTGYLRDLVNRFERQVRGLQSRPYSIEADLESSEYFTADLEDRAEEAALRSQIITVDAMEQVGSNDLPEKPITFYAIVVGNRVADRRAYVRKTNPMKVVKPGWLFFEFGETLKTIANPVFVLESEFDLVLRSETIDIFSPKVFELLFYALTGVDASIRTWVRNVARSLPMSAATLDLLSNACRTKPRLRRRLHAIKQRGHLGDVTIAKFRQELRRLNYPTARFIRNGELSADPSDYGLLLQILNEDIFHGGFTDDEFAAERKTPVNRG